MTEQPHESFESIQIVDASRLNEVAGEELVILRGLTSALRTQLVEKSDQPHIRLWTPRDSSERFTSEGMIELRQAEGDEFYSLVRPGEPEDLGGVMWLKRKYFESSSPFNTTFAVRLYEGYEGQGLGQPFMNGVLEDYTTLHPGPNYIWLGVKERNERAKRLYNKLGFSSNVFADPHTVYGEIMTKIFEAKNPKIVVIGGGTGTFTVLSGLKQYTENLTAVVNMSDDGGSTGKLRDELGVLPPGDVRQCLVALSNHPILREVFQHRFKGGNLEGHSLGNLLLSGLEQMTGDFEEAIKRTSEILDITGQVVPITTTDSRLRARRDSGEIIDSEFVIGHMNFGSERPEIWLEPESHITASAEKAIDEADIVVIAPGNLYGSLAPALVVNGVREALQRTKAKKVYVANLVTKPGQTEGFKVHDFSDEIERFIGAKILDYVLFNTDEPPPSLLAKYTRAGELILEFDLDVMDSRHYQAVGLPLIAKDPVEHKGNDKLNNKRTLIRHDPEVLAEEVIKLLAR
jgi:uncharacterized cofD-like protein